ncbi:MAG: hypothetical protein Q7R62_01035 [bacterium]|nr:hypothetical protein [bacterium]
MKFFLTLFLIAILVIAGFEVYDLFSQREIMGREIIKLETQANILDAQNARLTEDINYFSREENQVKEFKSKFNYRAPDEKLIILVPSQEAKPAQ